MKKIKVLTILGTRPEIIRLASVMALLEKFTDHKLVHTGQNYDYELNQVFFDELGVREPDHFLNVDTSTLGSTLGEILIKTEKVLLEEKPVAITIHGRTKKEMSKVLAHWDIIKRGVEIAKGSGVLVVGNGDVQSIEDGQKKAKASGVAGVMIGRAILGKPWLFKKVGVLPQNFEERVKVLLEHIELFEKLYGESDENKQVFGKRSKSFVLMKKHIKAYLTGFAGAKELRIKLMECDNREESTKLIHNLLRGKASQ